MLVLAVMGGESSNSHHSKASNLGRLVLCDPEFLRILPFLNFVTSNSFVNYAQNAGTTLSNSSKNPMY